MTKGTNQSPLRVPLPKRIEGTVHTPKGVKRKPCPVCESLVRFGVWILKGEATYRYTSETCEGCGHEFFAKKV